VTPTFVIHLHNKDLALLYAIREFLGAASPGSVYLYRDGKSASFAVSKLKDLIDVIIPHFTNYPLPACCAKQCRPVVNVLIFSYELNVFILFLTKNTGSGQLRWPSLWLEKEELLFLRI